MRRRSMIAGTVLAALGVLAGCAAHGEPARQRVQADPPRAGSMGTLVVIGGAIKDDNAPVYERFVQLATPPGGTAVIVIATASSADEDAAAASKVKTFARYAPGARVSVLKRTMTTAESLPLIEAATAMYFTGGDQKRVVDRYRPGGQDTPEARAMRRLLARGGVIGGTSAGAAMMSDPMFHGGRSAEALGIAAAAPARRENEEEEPGPRPVLGPRIGPGMGFLPWAVTDSHFLERDRFGRLVAALEASGKRLGIGVSEDAAVEVDVATGELVGLSERDSLLVDVGGMTRPAGSLSRHGVFARLIGRGVRVNLHGMPSPARAGAVVGGHVEREVLGPTEPGAQSRAWQFFRRAASADGRAVVYELDGYTLTARRADPGVRVDIDERTRP